mmetsp:Transcript_17231/g.26109  ORF Transcript_17231/g.26109 Transcript_17231/m.26109 type:complete len:225 (-) Transcript_17231:9-683(-)
MIVGPAREGITFCEMSSRTTIDSKMPKIYVEKKAVSFRKLVNVRATLHANDMTSEEISKTWYTSEALYKLKKQMLNEESDSRGLETRSQKWRNQRHRRRCISLHLVMREQDFQDSNGENNPETIREKYLTVSLESQAVARHLGQNDELFVRSMIENEMKSIFTFDELIGNAQVVEEYSYIPIDPCSFPMKCATLEDPNIRPKSLMKLNLIVCEEAKENSIMACL